MKQDHLKTLRLFSPIYPHIQRPDSPFRRAFQSVHRWGSVSGTVPERQPGIPQRNQENIHGGVWCMKLSERGPVSPDTLMETKALRTHDLFFSPQEDAQNFDSVLRQVQEYISGKYSTLIVEAGTGEVKAQVKITLFIWCFSGSGPVPDPFRCFKTALFACGRTAGTCFPLLKTTRKMWARNLPTNWTFWLRTCAPPVMRRR